MSESRRDAELLASIARPHPLLLAKYIVPSLFLVVGAGVYVALVAAGRIQFHWQALFFVVPILLAPLGWIVRYYTLSYQIDDAGIRMGVGLLNRRESYVTFARIQDIHLDRSLVDRWIGLGTISIQTASGQSAAEVRLFGLKQSEDIRDALYRRLRRHHGLDDDADREEDADGGDATASAPGDGATPPAGSPPDGTATDPDAAHARSRARAAEVSRLLRELTEETTRLADAIQTLATVRAEHDRRAAALRGDAPSAAGAPYPTPSPVAPPLAPPDIVLTEEDTMPPIHPPIHPPGDAPPRPSSEEEGPR